MSAKIHVKLQKMLSLLKRAEHLFSSWKPVTCERPWVRIPLSPPLKTSYRSSHANTFAWQHKEDVCYFFLRRSTQVGRRGAPAKGVGRETGVRGRNPTTAGGRGREGEFVLRSAMNEPRWRRECREPQTGSNPSFSAKRMDYDFVVLFVLLFSKWFYVNLLWLSKI